MPEQRGCTSRNNDMYLVKIDDTIFPLGPSNFNELINNGDEKVDLLNKGEIVIQKQEKLRSIQLDLVIPGREYPFSYYADGVFEAPETYIKKLKSLKEDKDPFLLILTREKDLCLPLSSSIF